jgi:3-oxoacyl-[acyl-carrier-protein] synthase II
MELKRVVITGLGAVTPIGNNIKDFWNNLINGVSGSDMITHFNTEKFKTKFACEVKNFNPEDYYDRKEARRLDMFTIFAMVATDEAVRDSGMDLDKIDHDRVGVIYGSGIGGFGTFHTELRNFIEGDGTPRFNPFFIPKIIPDITAGHISMRYGFRGPNYATVSACATSTHGIIDAFNLIRLDKANIIIAGGSEAAINEPGVAGFNAMQALSTNNENYKTASRPFDASRDGFVMGEGSGSGKSTRGKNLC